MADLTREEAIARWVQDIAANKFNPKRSYKSGRAASLTHIWGDENRFMMRYDGREWVLAQLYRDRNYVALNGDGIDRWLQGRGTRLQTSLRNRVQAHPNLRSMVIPFQAIGGAGVDLSTARLVHVLDDTMVDDPHFVPNPPAKVLSGNEPQATIKGADESGAEMWLTYRKRSYSHVVSFISTLKPPTDHDLRYGTWRMLRETDSRWAWFERRHQLGEALFSAVGEDGRRHKFVSAFDTNENPPLYFLAQLPDGSNATTLAEGISALAPPIVHQARAEGRPVQRQGDVFFIPTDLTDSDVYALAARRVRRQCVLEATPRMMGGNWPVPIVGEVRGLVPCPCGCGHKRWSSDTPRGRRTLAIYGTAHTADEVVVTKKGTTYAKGNAYHDPVVIGEGGRRPDHRPIQLGEKWHLAVRNTVPRRRSPRREIETPTAEEVNA